MGKVLKAVPQRKHITTYKHRYTNDRTRIKVSSISKLIDSGKIKIHSNNFNIANDRPIAVYSMGGGGKPMPPRVKFPKIKPSKRGINKIYIKTASGKYYEGVLIKSLKERLIKTAQI